MFTVEFEKTSAIKIEIDEKALKAAMSGKGKDDKKPKKKPAKKKEPEQTKCVPMPAEGQKTNAVDLNKPLMLKTWAAMSPKQQTDFSKCLHEHQKEIGHLDHLDVIQMAIEFCQKNGIEYVG